MAGLGASSSEEKAEGRCPGSGPGSGEEGCRVTEGSPEMGLLADLGDWGFILGVVLLLAPGCGQACPPGSGQEVGTVGPSPCLERCTDLLGQGLPWT